MSGSKLEIAIVIFVILASIPLNALLVGYFLNRRWYRRKKRSILTWLRKRGLIESEERYMKSRKKF